jgi:hypothetical protein
MRAPLGIALSLRSLFAGQAALALTPTYGAEPWTAWWGNPVAPAAATVLSARGTARFVVLTPRLLRLEYSPDGAFEDAKTTAIWNRALPVPPFSTSTDVATNVTIIDTGAFGVLLTYTDDGKAFSAASLRVLRRTPAFWPPSNASVEWNPSMEVGMDAGQLGGTFHTLDDVSGFVGLNCSLLDPNHDSASAASYFPCDFGLLSKTGFAVVDDSRSPVWDASAGWVQTQDKAVCPADGAARGQHCFAGSEQDTSDPALCWAAGCCPPPTTLGLWYSQSRDDHFSDSLNCSACGAFYSFMHWQGSLFPAAGEGLVALNLYWNANPRAGAGGDNVASTFPPTQPGYSFARVMGFVYDPAQPQPAGTATVKIFYSATHLDHYTTASAADEADATSLGYSLVGIAGFLHPDPPPEPAPYQCYRPEGHHDLYLFAHGSDYAAALADYVSISGMVPIPRRQWLGVSWSKWNESEVQSDSVAHVRLLQAAGFPVDTLICESL